MQYPVVVEPNMWEREGGPEASVLLNTARASLSAIITPGQPLPNIVSRQGHTPLWDRISILGLTPNRTRIWILEAWHAEQTVTSITQEVVDLPLAFGPLLHERTGESRTLGIPRRTSPAVPSGVTPPLTPKPLSPHIFSHVCPF